MRGSIILKLSVPNRQEWHTVEGHHDPLVCEGRHYTYNP